LTFKTVSTTTNLVDGVDFGITENVTGMKMAAS
jgi:hypothetical protein